MVTVNREALLLNVHEHATDLHAPCEHGPLVSNGELVRQQQEQVPCVEHVVGVVFVEQAPGNPLVA